MYRPVINREVADSLLSNEFIGQIVDNVDTGFGDSGIPIYRVRVQIKGLNDKLPVDKLPFYPVMTSNSNSVNQSATVPPVGAYVLVKFLDQDFYHGIVTAVLPNKAPNKG